MGLSRNVPQPAATDLENTFSDDFSKLQGNHYIQAGFQLVLGTKRQTAFSQANGLWSFTGTYSGNPIADFLLGQAASFSQGSTRPRYYLHYRITSPYIQDRWKITKRLTLTMGLRFINMPTAHSQDNFESVFDPSKYSLAKAPTVTATGTIVATPNYDPLNGLIINGVNGVPSNFTNAHNNYWAPSFGFAWDTFGDGKTSLRGGYGVTYASNFNSTCAQTCNTNPPFVQTITLIQAPFPQPIGASVSPAGASTLASEELNNVRDPMIQSFSLSLEHRFGGNWFLSVAGAGNIARHLPVSLNVNQPFRAAPYDYSPVINAGSTFAYTLSPYQGYAAINTTNYIFNAVWDALEFNLRHPVGHNLFFSAAYTWQHGLSQARGNSIFGAASVQDSRNPQKEYGNSELNAPHIFTTSLIWTLPWFHDTSGFRRSLLGGWRYSNIATVQSGFSLSPGLSVARQGLTTRPNSTGVSTDGPKTVSQWFNTAAFAAPDAGYFGNAGPGTIRGPGTINFDMALYKSFAVTEHHAFEFRAEFFNIFNHTNFSTVSTALGSANFGRVTAARDPRIIEGVLRYTF